MGPKGGHGDLGSGYTIVSHNRASGQSGRPKGALGARLDEEVIRAAADLAYRPAKPLDNIDMEYAYRKKMVRVYVREGLLVCLGSESLP